MPKKKKKQVNYKVRLVSDLDVRYPMASIVNALVWLIELGLANEKARKETNKK